MAYKDREYDHLKMLLPVDPFSARQHTCVYVRICYSALYAIARPSVRPSVCLYVTRVDQSKTVQVRIMQLSPQSSPVPLVFAI